MSFLTKINFGVQYLFDGGSWKLKLHEKIIIDAVVQSIESNVRSLIYKQLSLPLFVERSNPRIIALHLKDWPDELRITAPQFSDALYKVRLSVSGKRETANITFFNGFISTIETKNHWKTYQGKTLEILKVEESFSNQSMAIAIDRQEHGKGDL